MEQSLADKFRLLPVEEKFRRIQLLSDQEALAITKDWSFWQRPSQKLPNWNFATWLALAGRGWGKTRVGAETVRVWAKENPFVNIAGPTAWDARNVMVEGPSGIMACILPGEAKFFPAKRTIEWSSGCKTLIFSADEPDRLRGPQCNKFWGDELAAWQYEEAWDQAMFGLRLGDSPQAMVTTTPKPTTLVKALAKDPSTHLTKGVTYDNARNLAKQFFDTIIKKYEGTRLGRQELMAEILEDNPNALWSHALIDTSRIQSIWTSLDLVRVVTAIDPAVSAVADSDETAWVSAGMRFELTATVLGPQVLPHYYVLDQDGGIFKPGEWTRKALDQHKKYGGDRVVGEVNNGGDLVEAVLRANDFGFAYRAVHASRGKASRAEPVAGLYEQGRVHHVGNLAKLEDEMCDFDPTIPPNKQRSPNRMDALVWAIWELAELGKPEPVELEHSHEEHYSINPDLDELEARLGL